MSRMMSRPRQKEGRGIGERMAEIVVYVAIVGALIYGIQWYFLVYLRAPGPALDSFIEALKSGNAARQYELLSAESRAAQSLTSYEDNNPLAHGFTERVASHPITDMRIQGDRAEADVTVNIRRTGQELYQAKSDTFHDHYVLVRESGAWRIALTDPKTSIKSLQAASRVR